MDNRILLRHLSGSKANQVDEFSVNLHKELLFGRESSCQVRYDAERDDLVSRQHCKITIANASPLEAYVEDAGSRNGTFVNKTRISNRVSLKRGDVVQLGAGGPEFQFDADPEPSDIAKPTRAVGASELVPPPPTREAVRPDPLGTKPDQPAPKRPVGKTTVETMLQRERTKSRRSMLYILLAAAAVVIIGAVVIIATREPGKVVVQERVVDDGALTPQQIAETHTDAVVFFEVGWKIVDTDSGRQLNQVYLPNQQKDKSGQITPIVPGAGDSLPVFVALADGSYEPMLTTDDGEGAYRAVGGRHSGSGFIVSSDGFILTNRHVAAAWHTYYSFPGEDQAGLLFIFDSAMKVVDQRAIGRDQFPSWVPAEAKFVIEGSFRQGSVRVMRQSVSGKAIEGRNDYLDVTLAKNRVRIPADLARVSDRIDVAMVKIDLPRSLNKLELNDNYDTVKPGEPAIVMGYPGISPAVVGVTSSKDALNPGQQAKVIPDPTISVGNVGRVIRGRSGLDEGIFSSVGDLYQLTVNTAGPGNSGGPVFDNQGKVIAIYTSGRSTQGATVSFAVPIRYGMELMGTAKVMD